MKLQFYDSCLVLGVLHIIKVFKNKTLVHAYQLCVCVSDNTVRISYLLICNKLLENLAS